MNIGAIVNNDLANGPGVRTSVFVAGCPLHCPGCHNPQLWDFNAGKPMTEKTIRQIIGLLTKDGIHRDLSILGGEPLAPQNIEGVTYLCRRVKAELPNVKIWVWTGYDLTQKNFCDIINIVDGVVDGSFVEELKPGDHPWRGSSNQNIWLRKGNQLVKQV